MRHHSDEREYKAVRIYLIQENYKFCDTKIEGGKRSGRLSEEDPRQGGKKGREAREVVDTSSVHTLHERQRLERREALQRREERYRSPIHIHIRIIHWH